MKPIEREHCTAEWYNNNLGPHTSSLHKDDSLPAKLSYVVYYELLLIYEGKIRRVFSVPVPAYERGLQSTKIH